MSKVLDPDTQTSLYGDYRESARHNQALRREVVRKALNLPAKEDDVHIDQSKNGMGWKELLAIAALMLGAGAGAAAVVNMMGDKSPVAPQAVPVDSEYEVRFFDAEGNPVPVERWSGTE